LGWREEGRGGGGWVGPEEERGRVWARFGLLCFRGTKRGPLRKERYREREMNLAWF
jgi:hypothetical protein